MQPRRIARELALLSASQMPSNATKLSQQELQSFVLTAVRTLVGEVKEALEAASLELRRSSDRLDKSKVFAADIQSAQAMLTDSLALAQTAINRLGTAVDLPELIQIANQHEVQNYALSMVQTLNDCAAEIDKILEASLVDWQLTRVAQVDRMILKIAVAEIHYLEVPERA
jgi:transcription antitermination protein NusB